MAVSGDTVVIGAPHEDSSATGVSSVPNEDANHSGASHVFAGLGSLPQDDDADGLLDSWELTYWPTISGHSAPWRPLQHRSTTELLELAFGLNPITPNAGGLPPVTNEGGYLTMTIMRQPGVTCEVQSAGTLLPGQPASFSTTSTTVLINNTTTLKVRDNMLMGTASTFFVRVKVTAAP